MRFIGRKEELNRIKRLINMTNQNNILIYGRRRIGKSYLIKKALEDFNGKVIHYQCKEISYSNTIEELSNIISKVLNINYRMSFLSIEDILDFLFNYNENIVLVLDEYPYLLKKIEGLNSIIQNKIDLNKYESKLKLILSGSQIEIMKNMIDYASPLFGRFNDVIELKEHNYIEAAEYYPNYSNEEKVLLYSIFGGEPLYNSAIDCSKSVEENIIDLIVKENSFVELNIQNMVNIELSKIGYAYDVLQAIATGTRKNDDLVTKSHAPSPANLNPAIQKLLKMDLIKKISPINDENNKKKIMYFINNNALRFYYKYIYRFSTERNNMNAEDFYNKFIKTDLYNSLVPVEFENIAKQFLLIQNKNKKITPAFSKIGTFWYDDKKNKINGQFDLVTLDENGYIFYEVKYTKDPVDSKVINEEINQLSKLGISYYKLGFISKTGFKITTKNDYILISLEDIYNINV